MSIKQATVGFDNEKDYEVLITRQTRARGKSVSPGERVTVRGKEARTICGAKKGVRWEKDNPEHVALAKRFDEAQKKAAAK